jgi:hypothetical protein
MSKLEPLACREFVANVTAYLEWDLEDDVATAFEQHTLICPGCSRYLRQTRTAVSLFSGRNPAPSPPRIEREPPVSAARAYKFLVTGGVSPFTGFAWPEGDWVSIKGPARACRRGVHACRVADMPYWLNDELWRIELAVPVLDAGDKLVSVAGRLAQRIVAWDDDAALRFARWCAARVRSRAVGALQAAGLSDDAERVLAAADGEAVALCEGLAERSGAARAACGYAAAAYESLVEEPPVAAAAGAAYTAALCAAHAEGRAGGDAERREQAQWLGRELGLREASTPTLSQPLGRSRAPSSTVT